MRACFAYVRSGLNKTLPTLDVLHLTSALDVFTVVPAEVEQSPPSVPHSTSTTDVNVSKSCHNEPYAIVSLPGMLTRPSTSEASHQLRKFRRYPSLGSHDAVATVVHPHWLASQRRDLSDFGCVVFNSREDRLRVYFRYGALLYDSFSLAIATPYCIKPLWTPLVKNPPRSSLIIVSLRDMG